MDTYEIAVLAEERARKRIALESMKKRDLAGLTVDERVKAEVEYEVALAEYMDADRNLAIAQGRFLTRSDK